MNNNYGYEDMTATVDVSRTPDYQQTQPPQYCEAPPINQGKKKSASKFLTVLLSIVLFFACTFSVLIYDARNALKADSIEEMLEGVAFTDLVVDCGIATEDDLDEFYNDIYLLYGVEMSDESLNSFVDNSDIKQFFANRLADFSSDFLDGKSPELVLTKRDVVKLFTDNAKAFRDEFGLYATIGMMGEIVEYILDGDDRIVVLSAQELQEDFPFACSVVRKCLSITALILLIALSVVIILIMMIRSFSQGACGTGVVFVIIGLVKLVLSFAVPSLLGASAIATLIGNFMISTLSIGITLLVLGIVLLILSVRHRLE